MRLWLCWWLDKDSIYAIMSTLITLLTKLKGVSVETEPSMLNNEHQFCFFNEIVFRF